MPSTCLRIGIGGRLQIGMQMPHALGHAGRAGRIEPECRLLRMRRHGRERIAFALRVRRQSFLWPNALAAGHDDMLEIRHAPDDVLDDGIQRLRHEQHARAAIGQHVGILIRGQQRVERHRHDAGADRAEKHGGKSTVSSMIIATRSSRRTPSRRSMLATRQLCFCSSP